MDPIVNPAIDGVHLTPLAEIETPEGAVLHFVRGIEAIGSFGEVYFSEVHPGVVKAWKLHKRQKQNFCVPVGRIFLVLYDDRHDSPTRGTISQLSLGRPDAYCRLTIPHGIWYGFKGSAPATSLICNVTDIPHDPAEAVKMPIHGSSIPFNWDQSS